MHLGIVEQHVDLAVHHDGVVDRPRTVGVEVALIALGRRIDPHLLQDGVMIDARG
jgi:hypothetical protein